MFAAVTRTRRNFDTGTCGSRPSGYAKTYPEVGGTYSTSNTRVAVIVPSAEGEKHVAPVPPTHNDAGALGSPHNDGVNDVPDVAATSVCSSSHFTGAFEDVVPSKLMPHWRITMSFVEGVATCNSVLIAVPVATDTCAAVVGLAPFAAKYSPLGTYEPVHVSVIVNWSPEADRVAVAFRFVWFIDVLVTSELTIDTNPPIDVIVTGSVSVPFAVNTGVNVQVTGDVEDVLAYGAIFRIRPPPAVVISPDKDVAVAAPADDADSPTNHAEVEPPSAMTNVAVAEAVVPADPPGVATAYQRSTVRTEALAALVLEMMLPHTMFVADVVAYTR